MTALVPLLSAWTVWLAGNDTQVGPFVSRTSTWKSLLALLPKSSVAVHVTVVSPIGKGPPDVTTVAALIPFGRVHTTIGVVSTRSDAFTT